MGNKANSYQTGSRHRRHRAEVAFLLVALILTGLLLHTGYQRFMRNAYPLKYDNLVTAYSNQYDFSPSLIYALIRTESGFDPNAVSNADAVGLMQLTRDTFDWAQSRVTESEKKTFDELSDPETNIQYGVLVLSMLREQFSDTRTMLAAYNAGIGNVKKWLRNAEYSDDGVTLKTIPYEETRNYVDKIPAAQRMYEELYNL